LEAERIALVAPIDDIDVSVDERRCAPAFGLLHVARENGVGHAVHDVQTPAVISVAMAWFVDRNGIVAAFSR